MSRPKKWRRVCHLPKINRFGPLNNRNKTSRIIMTIDEFETIRLIDLERLKQEECAVTMNVARTTVQSIYDTARRKLADSLVNGKDLVIEGGDYMLCDEFNNGCGRPGCNRFRRGRAD